MSLTSTHPNAWSLINDLVRVVLVVGDPRCRVLPRRRRSLRFRARLEKAITPIVVNVDDALVAAANRADGAYHSQPGFGAGPSCALAASTPTIVTKMPTLAMAISVRFIG